MTSHPQPRTLVSNLALVAVAVFCVWWRGHTFGPSIREVFGSAPYPVVKGEAEPLDCDEAIYAYIGHRLLEGDVLYRDVSENKPPLGYWIYAAAVGIGGYDELAVRLLPIPFVVLTVLLIGWIGRRLGRPWAGVVASLLFALASTDVRMYGNAAQFEHFINLFTTASLACLIRAYQASDRRWLAAAGGALALAVLVKQLAVLPGLIAAWGVLRGRLTHDPTRPRKSQMVDLGYLLLGGVIPIALAAIALMASGAGQWAYDDILRFGPALATDTLPQPNAPPLAYRWLTGNAAPDGGLAPPFGRSDYVVWWAGGTWPLWLASIPASVAVFQTRLNLHRLVLGWYVAAWAMTLAPGLYWVHYYLLPVPCACLVVALGAAALAHPSVPSRSARGLRLAALTLVSGLVALLPILQVRDYILVDSTELTRRFKKGQQWVGLREMGRDLAHRTARADSPTLLIWGWQSPLYVYGGLDCPTRHAFTNDLMRDRATDPDSLVAGRIRELMADIERSPPDFVMAGYEPFPALKSFLARGYVPHGPTTPGGRGFWVRRDRYGDFLAKGVRPSTTPPLRDSAPAAGP